jgi:GntR family transcriptional repressor for pyruvate dehydrogenase complex
MDNTEYQTLAGKLAARIETGEYAPLEKLPPERRLAEMFGVSRNTVREAIRTLAEKGLVESRPGAGTFVAEKAGENLARAMFRDLSRRRRRLREVFEIRELLEPQIAALAAARISGDGILTLEEIVGQQKKAHGQGRDPGGLDELFHRILVRSAGNSVLFTVYETISGILSETRSRELQSPQRARLSIETHGEIVAALRSGNASAAAELMKRHMTEIATTLPDLSTDGSGPGDTPPEPGSRTGNDDGPKP